MKKQSIALIYGWIFILAFILIGSFVLTLILQFTTISSSMLSWIAFAVGLLGLFVGGLVTGVKENKKAGYTVVLLELVLRYLFFS